MSVHKTASCICLIAEAVGSMTCGHDEALVTIGFFTHNLYIVDVAFVPFRLVSSTVLDYYRSRFIEKRYHLLPQLLIIFSRIVGERGIHGIPGLSDIWRHQ